MMISAVARSASIPKILLVGNPNVGKSVLFSHLTGKYTIVSNYPGTTVEISKSNIRLDDQVYELIDSPGINALVPQSEDEKVTRDIILQEKPDIIIQVGDAKNLRRTLFLTLQLAEFGIPMILNLNMIDECRSRGIELDTELIEELFDIPVNTSIATMGVGIPQLLKLVPQARRPVVPVDFELPFLREVSSLLPPGIPAALSIEWILNTRSADIEILKALLSCDQLNRVSGMIEQYQKQHRVRFSLFFQNKRNTFLKTWAPRIKQQNHQLLGSRDSALRFRTVMAFLALGIGIHLSNYLLPPLGMPSLFDWMSTGLGAWFSGPVTHWFTDLGLGRIGRHLFTPSNGTGLLSGEFGLINPGLAILIAYLLPMVLPFFYALKTLPRFASRLDHYARKPLSGIPILILFLSATYVFVGLFGAQVLVGFLEETLFNHLVTPAFSHLLSAIAPIPFLQSLLVGEYGLVSMGLTYAIAIVFPVVGAFFLAFGFLEDSGYLPRLAILVNRVFRMMGLSGKAVLPMVLGLGCDTMATMTARILNSPKERLIATILLALGVPCSAQLGVILGIFAGVSANVLLVVLGVVLLQLLLVGYLAGKLLPGENSDFVLEIPPIRYPAWGNIFLKTRIRIVWFLKEAVPLFLLGTFFLFLLDRLSLLQKINDLAKPVVHFFLGLPEQTAEIFIMGFLRRDYGAAGLFKLVQNHILSNNQVAVALIVLTLFVPCIANFLVILKEQGLRKALSILGFIIPFALATGGAVHFILNALGIRL